MFHLVKSHTGNNKTTVDINCFYSKNNQKLEVESVSSLDYPQSQPSNPSSPVASFLYALSMKEVSQRY